MMDIKIETKENGKTVEHRFTNVSSAAKHLGYPTRPTMKRFMNKVTNDERNVVVTVDGQMYYSKGNITLTPATPATPEPVAEPVAEPVTEPLWVAATPEPIIEKVISPPVDPNAAAAQLIKMLTGADKLDEAQVHKIIDAKLAEHVRPNLITIQKLDLTKVNIGLQHYAFEDLMMNCEDRLNTMLVGPAGSFKTSAAEQIAVALELKCDSISVNSQTTKSDLVGFIDVQGVYRPSGYRKRYENGGVFILDEADAGNANVLTLLNSGLSNGAMTFPDERIQRHPDFIMIATANTYGDGANRQFVGRNQLDKATTNRFCFIDWNYDEAMEFTLSVNKDWCKKVQKIREIAGRIAPRHIVSPRSTFDGEKMLARGKSEAKVLQERVWADLNPDLVEQILKELK